MNTFLSLALLGALWDPPPPAVAKALKVVPAPVAYTHAFNAGLLATSNGRRPAMGYFY